MEQQEHIWPLCNVEPWTMGEEFYQKNKVGILQYTFFKPLLSLITFILNLMGKYCDGEFKSNCGYPYIAFIYNCSQMWALYCLVLFYMATKEALAPLKPVPKFLCIKLVVFFTWWQGLGIQLLAAWGLISGSEKYTKEETATSIQDFTVCIEMCIFSIAHIYAFKVADFFDPDAPIVAQPFFRSIARAADLRDIGREINETIVKPGSQKIKVELEQVPQPIQKIGNLFRKPGNKKRVDESENGRKVYSDIVDVPEDISEQWKQIDLAEEESDEYHAPTPITDHVEL